MRSPPGLVALFAATALLLAGVAPASAEQVRYDDPVAADPLAGRIVVLDPGHQLGNSAHPHKVGWLVPAGGFTKPCNTTGTSTDGGFPEATFTWRVALLLRDRLERRGARVLLTRDTNSRSDWGPCVDRRGRAGNEVGADLKVSLHGDGNHGGGPGFHVIAPPDRKPWTRDIYQPSQRFAKVVRHRLRVVGLPVAKYIAGGDGLDVRADLGTLNLSDVPVVLVELGNMRDRADAHRMTTRTGRARYARALAAATYRFLR